MAATMSAWSKPGAWALDSEENEEHLLNQYNLDTLKTSNLVGTTIPEADFPSLDAVSKTKAKKKKPQKTLSLSEFATYTAADKHKVNAGLTPDELLILPTAPRERTEEELKQSRYGGGFRSYDGNRGSRGSDDSRSGGFNREGGSREFGSSRADENDNWGATKKSPIGGGGAFDRDFGVSRADENDNWGAGKKAGIGGGGGFERRERGEKGGFFSDLSQSRADDVDNWAASKAFVASDGRRNDRRGGFETSGGRADSENWMKKKEQEGQKFGGSFDSLRSRRGASEGLSSQDIDTWGRRKEEGNGSGVVATRPRLNLQPRTKPLSDGQKGDDDVVKPKGLNPFGEARPREEVLKEKGQDWKETDEKLEAGRIKEGVNSPNGKRGLGISNGRGNSSEGRTERAWRKQDSVDPPSSETSENGHVEEPQDGEPQA